MQTISACRVCGTKNIKPFFDLGKQPLANSLLGSPNDPEKFYSLSLSFCPECSLVQLNETIDPKELFSKYVWVTSTSKAANDFAETFYKELVERASNSEKGYVLEIASNDGTFLLPFLRNGHKVLGVDPAENIVKIAEKNGVVTRCAFFGEKVAEDLVREYGNADIVFARNVLPHVANTEDFVRGLRAALSDSGVLAIEVHYAQIILEGLHYDSIYHEHLCYFTLKSLEKLLNTAGLFVFDITRSPISGGSIIVYAKKRKVELSESVLKYRVGEEKDETNTLSSWENFAKRSFEHRGKLLAILNEVHKRGDVLVGWGASARSSTMLNFCGIDSKILPVIIDTNPLKQGRYTAGTHIPIKGAESVMDLNPKTVFVLAWNFADEIMAILKSKFNYKGGYVIPLPNEPRVLSK